LALAGAAFEASAFFAGSAAFLTGSAFFVSVLAATALAGVKLVFNAFGASATGATYLEAF
jgi:hypothetical protein